MRILSASSLASMSLYRVLFFLSCAALQATALSSTLFWGNTFPMAYYFLFIVGFATFWSAYTLRGTGPVTWSQQEAALGAFLLALTLAAFATRFHQLGEVAPWCDEDWHNMRLPRQPDVVDLAAWINQPPIHYYFSKFSMAIQGRSLFAIRFFPAVFSALTVPLFFSFLRKTCRSAKYAIAGSLALLASIWLVSYAKEAKPYSGGIFFFLIFLHALLDFLAAPRELKRWVSLVVTGVIALLSLGLQPLLLLFGCAILFAAYFAAARDLRSALLVDLALLASAVIFAPFQIYLLRSSLTRNGFVKSLSLVHFLRDELAPNIRANLHTYALVLKNGLFLLAPLLSAALLYRLFTFRRTQRSAQNAMQLGLLGLAHLFPLVFLFAYGLVVDSPLEGRYLLLYIPVFLAGAAYSLESAEEYLSARLPRLSPALSLTFTAALAALTLPYLYYSSVDRSQKPVEHKWLNFYQYVRDHNELKNAAGFIFTLARAPFFSLDGFIHTDFFYTAELRKKILINSEWDVFGTKTQIQQILERLESGIEPSHIIFFYLNAETHAPLGKYKFSPELEAEVVPFEENEGHPGSWDATMVRIKNKFGFASTLEKFFHEIERQEPNDAFKLKLNELFAGIRIAQKDCAQANLYFRKLAPCANPGSRYGELEPFCRDYDILRDQLNAACAHGTQPQKQIENI